MLEQVTIVKQTENCPSFPLVEQLQQYVQLQAEIEQHLENSPELRELLDAINSGEGWNEFTRLAIGEIL